MCICYSESFNFVGLKNYTLEAKILEERIAQKDWHKKGKVFLKMAGYFGD